MTYLSHLLIDVGDNPDRPRPGRLWLRNIYHVHQRLCMAYPSAQQRAQDPHFLRPYSPDALDRPRFLFRVDNAIEDDHPRAVILVQSDRVPDWDYAFHNAAVFLAANPESREYNPSFTPGQDLRFRIRVNLSKKSNRFRNALDRYDPSGRPLTQGKRVALTWDEDRGPGDTIQEWFAVKAAANGFRVRNLEVLHLGWVTGRRPGKALPQDGRSEHNVRFRSALLEGSLTVTDSGVFAQAWQSGIGHAKAFGFGLLSLAHP